MINANELMSLIARWGGTMTFFPSDPDARIGIADEIAAMADDIDEVRWLVREAPKEFNEWPGILPIRALFCTQFDPRDGVQAICASVDRTTERLKEEREQEERLEIAGSQPRQLTGEVEPATADHEMAALVERISQSKPQRLEAHPDVDVVIRQGEDIYTALARSIREWDEKHPKKPKPYAASEAQIEFIKAEQNRNRKESAGG
jgi:hypothetical protein